MLIHRLRNGLTGVFACLLLISTTAGVAGVQPAQAQGSKSAFEKTACKFDMPGGMKEGKDIQCGFVTVPENHAKPDGATIKLAVAILRSKAAKPADDAVIYLQGGPGGATLDQVSFYGPAFDTVRETRDVILFDQRGIGLSEPALNCPEELKVSYDLLSSTEPKDKQIEQDLAATKVCIDKQAKSGIHFEFYNSAQNAADVDTIRQVLGYKLLDLYGTSYGTRLGLTVMRDFPKSVRLAILDSVNPIAGDLPANIVSGGERAFTALFDACAKDAVCNKAYPDLGKVFYKLVDDLNAKPVTAEGHHPLTGKVYKVVIDGDTLVDFLFSSMYVTDYIPSLPQNIYDVKNGNYDLVADRTVETVWEYEGIALDMYYATDCHDEEAFTSYDKIAEAAKSSPPEIAHWQLIGLKEGFAICDMLNAGKAGPIEDQPVKSDIPALVVSGHFDPITAPSYAQGVAKDLSKSFFVEVPNGGHAPSLASACGFSLVEAFIADPTKKPDDACLADLTPVTFTIPASQMDIKLVPFNNKDLGVSGLAPDGWTETDSGVYSAFGANNTQIRLVHRVRDSVQAYLDFLQSANNLTEKPKSTGTVDANGMKWTLYHVPNGSAAFDVAGVDVNGKGYIIVLLTPSSDYQKVLYDAVFLPDVKAFKVSK